MSDTFASLHQKSTVAELPTPAAFRQSTPAVLKSATEGAEYKRGHRRQLVIGIGVVMALHIAVAMAWWLTPKIRLKTGPAPEQWVQIVPLAEPLSNVEGSARPPQPQQPSD